MLQLAIDSLGWSPAELNAEISARVASGALSAVTLPPPGPDFTLRFHEGTWTAQLPPLPTLTPRAKDVDAERFVRVMAHRHESLQRFIDGLLELSQARLSGTDSSPLPSTVHLAARLSVHHTAVARALLRRVLDGPKGKVPVSTLLRPLGDFSGTVTAFDASGERPIATVESTIGPVIAVGYTGWGPKVGATIRPREIGTLFLAEELAHIRERHGDALVIRVEGDVVENEPPAFDNLEVLQQEAPLSREALVGAWSLFDAPERARIDGKPCAVVKVDAPPLSVPSGILGAADLGRVHDGMTPLLRRVTPGTFACTLLTVDTRPFDGPDVRVAAAQLELSSAPVVRWVEARTSEGPTVGVDSANVTFFDAQVVGSLRAAQLAHAYDTFATSGAMAFALGLLDGHAVVVPSGWGDGRYPLAWGLDAEGVPARLAIDFGVVRFE